MIRPPPSQSRPAGAILFSHENQIGRRAPATVSGRLAGLPEHKGILSTEAPAAPALRPDGIAARARAGGSGGGAPRAYLNGLNPEQRAAVETLDGPVLVLAGAGTGKTRVLTTRIAHILSMNRAFPSQILAVTFTNKAAREMKERIHSMVGDAVEGMPWLGTFHSIGVRILRRHHELVGLRSGFTILDTDDQIRLLKQLLAAETIDEKRWPARLLAATIDGWKNRGLTPAQVSPGEGSAFANGRGVMLYAAYQARLKALNAVDFGDLLLEGIRLFRENPDVLADYHRRFKFLLVDEYQDTNVAQYLWLRLLAQGSQNVCCVGDDDQSIYGWRGAEVDNILRFESDFPGATVIRLEPQLPLHRPYSRRGRPSHRQQSGPARQDPVLRRGDGRARHRHRLVGFGRGGARHRRRDRAVAAPAASALAGRHPRARLVPDARVRGPFRHARHALPGDRRPALL